MFKKIKNNLPGKKTNKRAPPKQNQWQMKWIADLTEDPACVILKVLCFSVWLLGICEWGMACLGCLLVGAACSPHGAC